MILEERDYLVGPGQAARYLAHWESQGREPQERHLGASRGVFVVEVGELNTVVFHWLYASLDDRTRRRADLLADPDFAAFRSAVRELVVTQKNRLLLQHDPRGR